MDDQNARKPADLSVKKELAVRQMVKGKGVVATAKFVGVTRVTLYRWMQEPAFVAAMNRWRLAVTDAARGQMFATLIDAAQAVSAAVRKGDSRLALAVLEKMGALAGPVGTEAGLDAETVIRQTELARWAEKLELDRVETQLAQAEERDVMLRHARTPTVRELAEADRVRQEKQEVELARKAAEEAEREAAAGEEGALKKKSEDLTKTGDSVVTSGSGEAAAPKVESDTGPPAAGGSAAEAVSAVAKPEPPSTRMSMAEIGEMCDQLTRRRGQPLGSPRPLPAEVVPPSSPEFIGPPPPPESPYRSKPNGGLNPLADWPVDPIDPDDDDTFARPVVTLRFYG